jgi:putative protease
MNYLSVTCTDLNNLEAVKKAGADEVILALQDACWSLSDGFSIEEILSACITAHALGLHVSVLMNRLFDQEEKEEAEEKLQKILKGGVDAVFFCDPALLLTAEKMHAEGKMIYRPETLLTSSEDAAWWLDQGLQAVMISPLLTSEELMEIGKQVPHTGLQIHGHTLMSVSKRKLLSAYSEASGLPDLHERKNLFLKEAKRDDLMPVFENNHGTMIFTDFVLESFDYIQSFAKAGIERFEVDSEDVDPESVIDALRLYRSLLDGESVDAQNYRKKYDLPFSTFYYQEKTIK